MAYGTTISRGIIGDPSAQARGRRMGVDEDALNARKEEKAKNKKAKEPKDVPLRKWGDHQKIMKDMAKKLKAAKKEWRDEDDPTRKAELKEIWRRGNESYNEVSNTLQNMRNNYQNSWEDYVSDLQEKQGSDIYATEEGGFFNRKYPTAAENYRNLRGGGNMTLADSWQVGQTPVFDFNTQDVQHDNPAVVGDEIIDQWEVTGMTRSQAPRPLDSIPMVIDPSGFKFGDQSYADTSGATANYAPDKAFNPQTGEYEYLQRQEHQAMMGSVDRGAGEEATDPSRRIRMGFEDQGRIYDAQDILQQRLMGDASFGYAPAPKLGLGVQGTLLQNPPAPTVRLGQAGTLIQTAKDGMKTGRKKYDIDGNRIA